MVPVRPKPAPISFMRQPYLLSPHLHRERKDRTVKTGTGAAVLAAVATGALVLVPGAAAKTRTVSPGHSIQAAIDKSKPGDTVFVEKGTYKGSLDISTDRVTLEGERGTVLKQGSPGKSLC